MNKMLASLISGLFASAAFAQTTAPAATPPAAAKAEAKADKDVAKAKADLDAYRTSFGELINSVVPELPADAVAEELARHVDTLFAAIDASVAASPTIRPNSPRPPITCR